MEKCGHKSDCLEKAWLLGFITVEEQHNHAIQDLSINRSLANEYHMFLTKGEIEENNMA